MKKFHALFLLALAVSVVNVALVTCKAVTDNPNNAQTTSDSNAQDNRAVTIKGCLGDGFSVARGGIGNKSIAGAVSHIAAIPVIAGLPDLGQTQKTAVANDGSFNIEVTPEVNVSTLLLLVNDNAATLEEKAVGFASLRSSNGADLILFPFDMASRDMDFGILTLADGVALSSKSLESQQDAFTMEFNRLLETAYHNNLFKHIKNQYVNTDSQTGDGYSERTRCYFTGNISKAENSWFPISSWAHTPGFNMRINIVSPKEYTYQDIANGLVDVEMIPPQRFSLTNIEPPIIVSPDAPLLASLAFRSDIRQAYAPPWIGEGSYWNGKTGYVFEFDGREEIVDGEWRMNLIRGATHTELALFDLQAASPFTPDGSFIYYMPTFRMITDANRRIARIDLAWFAWNPFMCIYERVTDLTTFMRLSQHFTFSIIKMRTDAQGNNYNDGENFSDSLQMVPTRDWYLGSNIPSGGTDISWVRVEYPIAGVEYNFTLYPSN